MDENKQPLPPVHPKYRRGTHPNSLKNITSASANRWKKGESGNPDGFSLTMALKHRLAKAASTRDAIVNSTIEGAILREPTPFKEVWDRVEGRTADLHEIKGELILRIVDDVDDVRENRD